ncbi:hypothetical protein [Exiguobacterium sp. RIT594]|uniref:hypothetical protein n=1 Tax=Exiguobacterium sp. RIT594 TaxID=2282449 RepID=UPI000DF744A6|nr:hypothetical protein [Exiguobacterium sp. RIT594]RDB32488.1 hypothetical protein DVG79_12400 [Exiguobacterium sp. RIT594]
MDEQRTLQDILEEEFDDFTNEEKLVFSKILNLEDIYLSTKSGTNGEIVAEIVRLLKGLYN